MNVLLLRGAPGVGKTVVGRALSERLSTGALVEVDRFRAMIASCDWHDRAQHETALAAALEAASAFADRDVRPVVFVDPFGRDGLARAQSILDARRVSHHAFSLWAAPNVLRSRLGGRQTGYQDWGLIEKMNEEVQRIRFPAETFLDTTELSIEQVVDVIVATVSAPDTAAQPQVAPGAARLGGAG